MSFAVLQDSRGLNSLAFDLSTAGLLLVVRWLPQPFGRQAPCEAEIRLSIPSAQPTVVELREGLRRHLHRPVREVAATAFLGSYDLSDGGVSISLEFEAGSAQMVGAPSAGRGLAVVRYQSVLDRFEVGLPIDITVLDRFCSQLGDLAL